ncbi:unnamed protein product [Victoria cruziana]
MFVRSVHQAEINYVHIELLRTGGAGYGVALDRDDSGHGQTILQECKKRDCPSPEDLRIILGPSSTCYLFSSESCAVLSPPTDALIQRLPHAIFEVQLKL